MKFGKSIFTVYPYRVYLHFDHHLTTTVQAAPQNVGKACCDNQQQAFSCFRGRCAEPINFTFHRRSILSCRSSPTRKARGSNPPGRTKSSTLWGAALFVLHGFYGAAKGRIRTARAPRFASRGAETPRWGVSRARLGESLLLLPHKIRAKQKEQHPIRYCSWCDREDSNLWPSGSENYDRVV